MYAVGPSIPLLPLASNYQAVRGDSRGAKDIRYCYSGHDSVTKTAEYGVGDRVLAKSRGGDFRHEGVYAV